MCAQVLPKGEIPHTRHVRGSNFVLIGVFEDRLPGRAIVICVIDNLVKVHGNLIHGVILTFEGTSEVPTRFTGLGSYRMS